MSYTVEWWGGPEDGKCFFLPDCPIFIEVAIALGMTDLLAPETDPMSPTFRTRRVPIARSRTGKLYAVWSEQ